MSNPTLHIPFDSADERQFTGRAGRVFTYIDDERVMDRLDEADVRWQLKADVVPGEKAVKVTLGIYDGEWLWYEDFGYPTNAGDEAEWLKEAVSDGIRRTGRMVGIARYLYRGQSTNQPAGGSAQPPAGSNPARQPAQQAPEQRAADAPLDPEYAQAAASSPEDFCPDGHGAWYLKAGGTRGDGSTYNAFWTCPKKGQPYCKQRPSKAWLAAHER